MRRSPGRPRSEAVRRAVLSAAVRLVASDGYGAVTMEGIARSAQVSKQTLYRWWPRKADIVLEALNEGAQALAPLETSGSVEADLRAFVRRSVVGASPRTRRLLGALMAEAQLDEEFAESFRQGFLARRREVLRQLLEEARERGDIRNDADIGFLVELVFGMLWYRILGRHGPLNNRFADQLTDAVLALAG